MAEIVNIGERAGGAVWVRMSCGHDYTVAGPAAAYYRTHRHAVCIGCCLQRPDDFNAVADPMPDPPLEALRTMIDTVQRIPAKGLPAIRDDLVGMLECAADFVTLQAVALRGDRKAICKPLEASAERLAALASQPPRLSRVERLKSLSGRICWAVYFFCLGAFLGLSAKG